MKAPTLAFLQHENCAIP